MFKLFCLNIFFINILDMRKNKIVWFIIGCVFLMIMLFCSKIYRPWIYQTGLFDFYIADTYTNLFGVPTIFFLGISFFKTTKVSIALLGITAVYIFGEIFSWLQNGSFDYMDVIATFLGCGLALVLYHIFK